MACAVQKGRRRQPANPCPDNSNAPFFHDMKRQQFVEKVNRRDRNT
jgi:hypothetical protein